MERYVHPLKINGIHWGLPSEWLSLLAQNGTDRSEKVNSIRVLVNAFGFFDDQTYRSGFHREDKKRKYYVFRAR